MKQTKSETNKQTPLEKLMPHTAISDRVQHRDDIRSKYFCGVWLEMESNTIQITADFWPFRKVVSLVSFGNSI